MSVMGLRILRCAALGLALLAGACDGYRPHSAGEGLLIPMPGRLRHALSSTDGALCAKLDVRLTFGRTDDLGSPAIDKVALDSKPDATCTWVLADTKQLTKGNYDLVVRFATKDAPGTCAGPILAGAYVKRGIAFPFPPEFSGLTDADFYSRPGQESMLQDSTASFDPDMDGRDSLAEIATGSDPCKQSSVPVVTLEGVNSVTEGQPITLTLQSIDADDVQHRVLLSIKHSHSLAARPDYKTSEIDFVGVTNDPASSQVTPKPADRPPIEGWTFSSAVSMGDPRFQGKKGAASWTLTFTPRDPFVDTITFEYSADDGQGNTLVAPRQKTADVANVQEPARVLIQMMGQDTATSTLAFAEQGNPASSYLFRFVEADLTARADQWMPRIASVTPTTSAALTVKPNGGLWELDWSPSNYDAVHQPQNGYRMRLEFFDDMNAKQGESVITLGVDPLWNDVPWFDAPSTGDLALPKSMFAMHAAHFVVHDPDRVDAAPSCQVTIAPRAPTACMSPFQTVRCEAAGPRSGDDWPFQLILIPSTDYFAACGAAPSFTAVVQVTDAAPARASNGPQTFRTSPDCSSSMGPCVPDLTFRTADVVSPGSVSGGPGATPSFTGASPVIIDGVKQAGLVVVQDPADNYEAYLTLMDLSAPSPSFRYKVPKTTLCDVASGSAREIGAADEINHRLLVYSHQLDAGSCGTSNPYVLGVISVSDLSNPTVRTFTQTQYCQLQPYDHPGNPVVDTINGNFYIPCGDTPGFLSRIDPSGTLTGKTIMQTSDACNCQNNRHNDFIVDSANVHWLIWPDLTGILLVNLDTFDNAAPSTMRLTPAAGWSSDNIQDHVVDTARKSYVFTYMASGGPTQLWRIDFASGTPTVRGPLMLTGTSGARVLLRKRGTEPAAEADLVVDGSSGDTRPYVDLDGWRIVGTLDSTNFYLGYSPGLFPTPDHRYFAGPTAMNHETGAKGLYLYAWDPMVPRLFLDLGQPNDPGDKITLSRSGNMMVFSLSDHIDVVYFVEAAMGLDQ
jgi:hypothetical protein